MSLARSYFPAAGWNWLLPMYDRWSRLLGADAVRNTIVDQAALGTGQRILDVGCATGTLAVFIKQIHPGVTVVGLDPDRKALQRAMRKAACAGVAVEFDLGFSDQLPYADNSFDHVFCTFVFSILPHPVKEATLREIRRVLKTGGSFHVMDMVKAPLGDFLVRLLQPRRPFEVCSEQQILALMRDSGLTRASKTGHKEIWIWPIASYKASRSAPECCPEAVLKQGGSPC